MSYILDALRKAEHERHLGQPPNPIAAPPPSQPTRQRFWLWLVAWLTLGANAALLVFFLLWPRPAPPPATAPPTTAAAPMPTPATPVTQPLPPTPPVAAARKAPAGKPVTPAEPARPAVTTGRERRPEPPPKPASAPAVASGPEPAPLLDTLPAGARRGLPTLNLDLHAYSPDADKRFVVVNGRRYREGERLGEGPVLEAVTVNGAILRQGSQRFRLSVRR